MSADPPPSSATQPALPLDELQGNVVHGYSYPVASFTFARFVGGPREARAWLARVLKDVTPGTRWGATSKPSAALNLAFTHAGLQALGVPAASLDTFPADFREGMPAQATDLGDVGPSAPAEWEFGGDPSQPIHVLVSLHASNRAELEQRVALLEASFGDAVVKQHELPAAALSPDPRREHFGFRDGFGQPSVEGSGVAAVPGQGTPTAAGWADIKAGEFLLGWDDESGFPRPLPEPSELARNGTFLVFRKLHQDVASFRRFLREQAKQVLGSDREEHREWLASRLIGRWRSGAPVALSPDRDDPTFADDDTRNLAFDYRDDPFGAVCPVGSHIRRVNPRAGLPPQQLVRTHRILRRGLPYGAPLPEGVEQDDQAQRGVAFMALNASIDQQFRFIQRRWMNDGDFAGSRGLTSAERDPLGTQGSGKFVCFDAAGSPKSMFDLPRFVRMRGGGYFFVPSLVGLRFLANGSAPDLVASRESPRMFLSEFDALVATPSVEPNTVARARAQLVSKWLAERPAQLFAELLAQRPTLLTPGLCVVTRAPDVREVLEKDRVFSVRPYVARMERGTGAFILGMGVGAQYDRELSALRLATDRSDLGTVASISRQLAEQLIEAAAAKRSINLAGGYARLVAMRVIGDYLGTPGPDSGVTMSGWIASLFRDIFLNLANDPEVTAAASAAAVDLRGYLDALIASTRAQPSTPPANVLARLALLKTGDRWLLDEDAVRRCIGGTIVGALETVNKSFVHAVDQLLARPAELDRARDASVRGDDAALLASVLEAMRFNPQNPFLYRICEETFVLARGTEREVTIPAGTLVFAATQAAMHDPGELADAEAFRPGRLPESHLFFGHSLHTCLGQHIATVEWRELAKPLLRLPGLRRAAGAAGQLRYEGPFPRELWVEW